MWPWYCNSPSLAHTHAYREGNNRLFTRLLLWDSVSWLLERGDLLTQVEMFTVDHLMQVTQVEMFTVDHLMQVTQVEMFTVDHLMQVTQVEMFTVDFMQVTQVEMFTFGHGVMQAVCSREVTC